MTIKTKTLSLVYKGKVIKQRGCTDNTPEYVIKQWRKLYPKHLFDQCQILTDEGKEYTYDSYYKPVNKSV